MRDRFPTIQELSASNRSVLSTSGLNSTVFTLDSYPDIVVKTTKVTNLQRYETPIAIRLRSLYGFTKFSDYRKTGLIVPFTESTLYRGQFKPGGVEADVRDLYMPHMGMTFENYIQNHNPERGAVCRATSFTKEQIEWLFLAVSRPVETLHANRIVHCDVNSFNFYYPEQTLQWLGLGDFGSASDYTEHPVSVFERDKSADYHGIAGIFKEILLSLTDKNNEVHIGDYYSRELQEYLDWPRHFVHMSPTHYAAKVIDLLD